MSLYTDPVSDMLARVRNALMRKKEYVDIPYSKFKLQLISKLKERGYISNFAIVEGKPSNKIKVLLKYKDGESIVHEIKRVSKPGRRVYKGYKEIPSVVSGLGDVFVSTSKGVMTGIQAKKSMLGGEIIFTIW